MTATRIPVIDLERWTAGTPADRGRLAEEVDQALQTTGFLLVTGHGVDPGLPGRIRSVARDFFHQPLAVKERYAQSAGHSGWIGGHQVATARSEGTDTLPDLMEVWQCAATSPTGSRTTRYVPDRWPGEVPDLHTLTARYTDQMRTLADTVFAVMAQALGQPADFFTRHTTDPNWRFHINWYPAAERTGASAPGQFRVGPHTDFGFLTLLDRQAGKGGLQVHDDEEGWQDAPYEPGALTLNIGDLLARWSGDRWRSGRHRVLAPPADVPQEELISLVYFHTCAPDTLVTPLPAPVGRRSYDPVRAGEYIQAKRRAAIGAR
ncbi:2-oxoglutarate and iron-dependent oxygenase domain-containing protein [Streptomyces sp. NPDC049577]|uniref:isopenicillin N synthase family dioxygenase n=1 Tax=Streptomyces sp. NPDC049577 TaxID=3155153 RepID=UPI003426D42D